MSHYRSHGFGPWQSRGTPSQSYLLLVARCGNPLSDRIKLHSDPTRNVRSSSPHSFSGATASVSGS
ncbi:hypothetical protein DSO57_1009885 [Entomophthora muscae]|uniref:Uncharacterized protein n=1 Tax=Entomophthora muscae TaxID=34485 RepID=A0ACC2T6T5_9FUNG|nr:hypothetical protein DSO57_1009885 [Entomophthora muscae]